MDEQQPWQQLPGESGLWFGRFERYRLMWPHSIVEVYRDEWRAERRKAREEEKGGKEGIDSTLESELPKEAPGKWYEMARRFQWEERASAWDAVQVAEIEQRIVAERTQTLLTNFAQMHRRVAALNEQAERLIAMAKDPKKIWLPDVKAIGNGPFAERVDLVQFNAPLFHEIRACFADIAAELGERVKKKEVHYKELPPDSYEGIAEDDEGSEP
jgi:hypothetical protein